MSGQSLLAGCGAVVSGGSRGIRRAVAELLGNLGAGVVVNGRDADAVQETSRRLPRREDKPPRWSEQPTTRALPLLSSKNARGHTDDWMS